MSISDGELTSIALCWTMERADGSGLALTSHDQAVQRGGVSFEPSKSFTPAAVTRTAGISAAGSELEGALDAEALTEADLLMGRWNGARVQLSAVDWQDADGAAIPMLTAKLGEVAVQGGTFTAGLEGAASQLSRPVCPSTSPECRAELGDKACRVDLSGRSRRVSLVASSGHELTLDGDVEERFLLGRVRYLSGQNCGISTSILSVEGPLIRVRDLPRAVLEAGCVVELREGCDKRLQTCSERFGNAINFCGEPHLPGNDLLTRYPGS